MHVKHSGKKQDRIINKTNDVPGLTHQNKDVEVQAVSSYIIHVFPLVDRVRGCSAGLSLVTTTVDGHMRALLRSLLLFDQLQHSSIQRCCCSSL